jgi:hypothetical protein
VYDPGHVADSVINFAQHFSPDFAILLQLDRELWEPQREMMKLPTEPGGTVYTGFTAFLSEVQFRC